jgi:hypothetical protein
MPIALPPPALPLAEFTAPGGCTNIGVPLIVAVCIQRENRFCVMSGKVEDTVVGYQYVSSCQHCHVGWLFGQFTSATPRFIAPEIKPEPRHDL